MAGFTLAGLSSGASAFPAEGLNRILGAVAVLLLVPLCFYSLSGVFWKLYYPDRVATGFDVAAPQAGATAAARPPASWDWFTVHEAPKPKAVPAKINARLLGVFGVGDRGIAMISLNKGKPQNFRVGDEIKDGVVLGKLAQDHVILLRGEREEVLAMKKFNLFNAKKDDGALIGADERGISRDLVHKMLREQPLRLAQMVRFEPVRNRRYGRGVKITPRRSENETMFYNMGLIPGDVLLKANGQSMEQIEQKPGSWRPLLTGKSVRLELLRNGVLQNVTVNLGR